MANSTALLADERAIDHADFLYLLGFHHFQHRKYDRAILMFEIVLIMNPFHKKAVQALAFSYVRCNDPVRALAVLEQLPEAWTDDTLTWLLRGQVFTQSGRLAEAGRAMRAYIQRRRTHIGQVAAK